MKPRIFISSTFYDLKYIREDLANFVRAHDFEPIMFEDGDIGYTPGRSLDSSCYETMRNADMVILVVGGNYGSPATGEKEDAFLEYLSVTRKEFQTAVGEGIPVYVFVESAVYAEYGVYDSNIKEIEEKHIAISFKATKNINVFRFLKEIYSLGKISINEFRKPSEIKEFLSKQWSDMFKNYLAFLRSEAENKKVENSVKEMNSLVHKMDIMLDNIGKKLLHQQYENVVNQQYLFVLSKEICEAFDLLVPNEIANNVKERETYIEKFLHCLVDSFKEKKWSLFESDNPEEVDEFFDYFEKQGIDVLQIATNFLKQVATQYELLYDDNNLTLIKQFICVEDNFKKIQGL